MNKGAIIGIIGAVIVVIGAVVFFTMKDASFLSGESDAEGVGGTTGEAQQQTSPQDTQQEDDTVPTDKSDCGEVPNQALGSDLTSYLNSNPSESSKLICNADNIKNCATSKIIYTIPGKADLTLSVKKGVQELCTIEYNIPGVESAECHFNQNVISQHLEMLEVTSQPYKDERFATSFPTIIATQLSKQPRSIDFEFKKMQIDLSEYSFWPDELIFCDIDQTGSGNTATTTTEDEDTGSSTETSGATTKQDCGSAPFEVFSVELPTYFDNNPGVQSNIACSGSSLKACNPSSIIYTGDPENSFSVKENKGDVCVLEYASENFWRAECDYLKSDIDTFYEDTKNAILEANGNTEYLDESFALLIPIQMAFSAGFNEVGHTFEIGSGGQCEILAY